MIALRPAVPADALAVAQIHVRAWQTGYRDLLPAPYLASLRADERAARYTFGDPTGPQTSVAEEDGAIRGFVTRAGAEVAALHVDPDAWRQGIGSMLLAHARPLIAGPAHLWVLVGNARAERFYTHHGWLLSGETQTGPVWGVDVVARRYTHP